MPVLVGAATLATHAVSLVVHLSDSMLTRCQDEVHVFVDRDSQCTGLVPAGGLLPGGRCRADQITHQR